MRWCPGRSPRQGDGRPPWLLESHFGKASELARMQPFPLQRLELFQRLQPDVQLLAPRYVVWSSLFWGGLLLATASQARQPARGLVATVLVAIALALKSVV